MSTFYDPATIRRLAEHDPFYRGAAWILDQQAAAFDTVKHSRALNRALDEAEERRNQSAAEFRQYRNRVARRENWDDPWSPTPAA